MKVFLDNCLSPILAATLHGFLAANGDAACHIKDMPCGRDATDEQWIAMLAEDDAAQWLVLTGDTRIQRNPAERAAYRQAGLCGFVLAKAYQKTPMHQLASFVLWRWPEVVNVASLVARPALFELPIHRSSKIKQMPL